MLRTYSQDKIEIKNIFGDLLFSHKCQNNIILITVESAVISGADLRRADLSGANLPIFCK